jgi:hypothetical protein
MTTGDVLRERAITLAREDGDRDEAVRELEASSEGRRVAVVRARQQLMAGLEDGPDQEDSVVAIGLLDEVLIRLPA